MTSRGETKGKSFVLIALDGSLGAITALPVAAAVAKQLGADLEILHVVSKTVPEDDVRRAPGFDSKRIGKLTIRIRVGDPAESILREAEESTVALIALTTHGKTVESDGTLGHVAEAVIRGTKRPILLIRPGSASEGLPAAKPIKRLLFPFDGTPATAAALRPATDLAKQLGAEMDVLYVAAAREKATNEPGTMTAPRYVDQPHHEWDQWAREFGRRFHPSFGALGQRGAVFVASGDPGDEIPRFAAEHHYDAIVLARLSRLEKGRARALRGALRNMDCPVLLVGAG